MSKATDLRYTPRLVAQLARELLGEIDLDPASSAEPNEIIEASKIYTEKDDGLSQEWHGRVWLNWPASSARKWASKLEEEINAGRTKAAVVMLFNWDHSTKWFETLCDLGCSFVLFKKRIKFGSPEKRMYEVGRSQALAVWGVDLLNSDALDNTPLEHYLLGGY